MSERCYICERGKLENKKVDFSLYGISLGRFAAQVCSKCGEIFFSEEVSDEIDNEAKKRGLWGLEAVTKIGKVGNSFDVKINKKIAEFLSLKKGEEVRIYPEGKEKLVIEI